MSDYKYCLRWCGTKDTPLFRASVEQCKQITMFKHAEPRVVTHDEYQALIEDGSISKAESYWKVSPGQVGLITLQQIGNHSQWDMVSNCKADFQDGWEACLKNLPSFTKSNMPGGKK